MIGRLAALAMVLGLAACGGPRARLVEAIDARDPALALARYDELAARDGDDASLLGRVALVVLEAETASDDPSVRSDAVRELGGAGETAREVLDRVAGSGGPAALDAVATLARRGDDNAIRLLRGLVDHEDETVRAAAMTSLDPTLDRALLVAAVVDASPAVRAAAALRLGALGPDDVEARELLVDRARVDPEASVRGAAVRALGSYEAAAIPSLRDRLSDPSTPVRLAAIEALVRADRAAARETIGALLAMPPAMESIEAARILASAVGGPDERPSEEDRVLALGYLRQSLGAADPALRAQAGVALAGIPGRDELSGVLLEALGRETDPDATLALARAVLRRSPSETAALDRLRALASGELAVVTLEAAIVLGSEGDESGRDTVRRAIAGTDERLRRIAARALARDLGLPTEARPLLEDDDPRVRVAAAGGIVAQTGAR